MGKVDGSHFICLKSLIVHVQIYSTFRGFVSSIDMVLFQLLQVNYSLQEEQHFLVLSSYNKRQIKTKTLDLGICCCTLSCIKGREKTEMIVSEPDIGRFEWQGHAAVGLGRDGFPKTTFEAGQYFCERLLCLPHCTKTRMRSGSLTALFLWLRKKIN